MLTVRPRTRAPPRRRGESRRVELDLRGLTSIDCAGLSSILDAARTLAHRLTIYPGPPPVQSVFALLGLTATLPFTAAPPTTSAGAQNVAYVRRLCDTFAENGVDALLELVPDDVEWVPSLASGRVLHGSAELRSFLTDRAAPRPVPRSTSIAPAGADVLVRFEPPLPAEPPSVLWSLYQFVERRLVRAISYDDEADALRAAA